MSIKIICDAYLILLSNLNNKDFMEPLYWMCDKAKKKKKNQRQSANPLKKIMYGLLNIHNLYLTIANCRTMFM